jgi:aldehyde dehydrogenase (NAD+)
MHVHSLQALRKNFETGITRSAAFRKEQLRKLKQTILDHEKELYQALYDDLKKSPEESWVTELGLVIAEINIAVRQLENWMRPERVATNLLNFPSSSRVLREPLGVTLIISPWNYPFMLLINPLVGAIAAGNCVALKPSELAPATDAVMKKMIEAAFPNDYVLYLQGEGQRIVPEIMNAFAFDHIFYTGSTEIGRLVYKMAAEKLVPVTLELGGKSPCIVEDDADIKIAGRRIALTKFSNAGQMCVAPDYVLVQTDVKDRLIEEIKKATLSFFGTVPLDNYNYGKIINEKQFDRIHSYLHQGRIVFGGGADRSKLYIEPTIVEEPDLASDLMNDEIFGPVLPIIGFNKKEEAMRIVSRHPNPLAFYIFTSSNSNEKFWLENVAFGGACVNNASWHLTNHYLPFGGRGFSGTGQYHGRYSFETFSHRKAVMKTPTWFDPAIKYPPFKGKLKLFKWIVK